MTVSQAPNKWESKATTCVMASSCSRKSNKSCSYPASLSSVERIQELSWRHVSSIVPIEVPQKKHTTKQLPAILQHVNPKEREGSLTIPMAQQRPPKNHHPHLRDVRTATQSCRLGTCLAQSLPFWKTKELVSSPFFGSDFVATVKYIVNINKIASLPTKHIQKSWLFCRSSLFFSLLHPPHFVRHLRHFRTSFIIGILHLRSAQGPRSSKCPAKTIHQTYSQDSSTRSKISQNKHTLSPITHGSVVPNSPKMKESYIDTPHHFSLG